jgi:hypothetical protein
MNSLALNVGNVLIGILIGVGGIIALFSRLDRTGDSGCFYQLLLAVVVGAIVVIVLGMVIG